MGRGSNAGTDVVHRDDLLVLVAESSELGSVQLEGAVSGSEYGEAFVDRLKEQRERGPSAISSRGLQEGRETYLELLEKPEAIQERDERGEVGVDG